MAMDESPLQLSHWSLQLQRGEELTLPPGDDEPFVVTEVFLVDPESAAGQGVVSAYVEMGTQEIMLAQLSSEVKAVELESPLVLEEDFRVYVMPPAGGHFDTNTDEDAVVVQFKGFLVSRPVYDTDEESEEEEEEGDEEDASSEDDETDEENEESDGEVYRDVATASNVDGNGKDVGGLQLEHLGLCSFAYQ